jgi:hypothetical protein
MYGKVSQVLSHRPWEGGGKDIMTPGRRVLLRKLKVARRVKKLLVIVVLEAVTT